MLDIADISAACGHITASNLNGVVIGGTGYLVAPLRLATCAHVVDGVVPETIQVRFDGGECAATLLDIDRLNDCAILELASAPEVKPLPLGGECVWKAPWDGYGYPAAASGGGITTQGIVSNPGARDDLRVAVLELTCPEAAAGMATPLHGFSGSPVIVNGMVVGHIKRFVSDPDKPERPAFGKVYAVHSRCVASLLSVRAPVARPEVTAPRSDSADGKAQVEKVLGLLQSWSGKDMPYEEARLSVAESLIQLGEPDKALKVLDSPRCGLRDVQLRALALAKTDDATKLDEAVAILQDLWRTSRDAETGGLLAGRYKQKWERSGGAGPPDTRDPSHLRMCHRIYLEAFDLTQAFYPGINAAATALWLGELDLSKRLAQRVRLSLQQVAARDRDVWYHATEAEAVLLLDDAEVAAVYYRRAAKHCAFAPETINTMRSQVRRNLRALGRGEGGLDAAFVPD